MGLGAQRPWMPSDASHLICFLFSLQLNISRSPPRPQSWHLFYGTGWVGGDQRLTPSSRSGEICGENGCINGYHEAALMAETLLA